jgi:hypothetical protein
MDSRSVYIANATLRQHDPKVAVQADAELAAEQAKQAMLTARSFSSAAAPVAVQP